MKKSQLKALAEKLEAENERLRDRLYGCTEADIDQSFEDCYSEGEE